MSTVSPIGIGNSPLLAGINPTATARAPSGITGPSPSGSTDSVAALVDAMNRMIQGAAGDPQAGPLMQLLLALFVFLALMQGGGAAGQNGQSAASPLELMRQSQGGAMPQTGALAIYVEQTSITYSQTTMISGPGGEQAGPSLGAQLDFLA